MEETPPLYLAECSLNLFSKEEGGRDNPIGNGCRPNHVFEYEKDGTLKYTFIGDFQFGENNLLNQGMTKNVTVRFLTHQPIEQYLYIGKKWWIHEGPRKIGEAEIIKIELPKKE